MSNEWLFERSFFNAAANEFKPVVAVAFDPIHELLWAATDDRVTSFVLREDTNVYTRFKVRDPVWDGGRFGMKNQLVQIHVQDYGVYSLSNERLSMHSRGGMVQWDISHLPQHPQSHLWSSCCPGIGAVDLVAFAADQRVLCSIQHGKIVRRIEAEERVNIMLSRSKLIACGTNSGRLFLKNPHSMRTEETLRPFSGAIADMDSNNGNLIAATAFCSGANAFMFEQVVKVYDTRKLDIPLADIPMAAGAKFVRFNPTSENRLMICSALGSVVEYNVTQSKQVMAREISPSGQPINDLSWSSSGNRVAFGDASGMVHVWDTSAKSGVINYSSLPIVTSSQYVPSDIGDDDSLSAIGMPFYHTKLLSSQWPGKAKYVTNAPAVIIPGEILDSVKYTEFIGSAANTLKGKRLRNQVPELHGKAGSHQAKFRSELEKSSTTQSGTNKETEDTSLISATFPEHYQNQKIHYSRFGVEDFAFDQFNSTEYAGLENNLPNCYCNALLQVYLYAFGRGALSKISVSHIAVDPSDRMTCHTEFCIMCEFGFLSKMINDAHGSNCQATNFFRALSNCKEAFALGLLEPNVITPKTGLNLLIQNLNRFLLDYFQNISKRNPVIQNLCGLVVSTKTTCSTCKTVDTRELSAFALDLAYKKNNGVSTPQTPNMNKKQSLEDLLRDSLCRSVSTKAWCNGCRNYAIVDQTKTLTKLPNILNIHCGGADSDELTFWEQRDLRFNFDEVLLNFSTFIPETMTLIVKDGQVQICKSPEEGEGYDYEVMALICQVENGIDPVHLVSFINMGDGNWLLFNDFLVKVVSKIEALQIKSKWKRPAIIQYSRKGVDLSSSRQADLTPRWPSSEPIQEDGVVFNRILNKGSKKIGKHVVPLTYQELTHYEAPFLIGIDAEFVALSKDETEVRSDGTRSVVRPAKMHLARISLLRGSGSRKYTPLVDDYITTSEPILDYLTEFSGITANDLHPQKSSHHIVPLKEAYRKLRMLVDMGFTFVGHGLRKDFRTINIFVPTTQVIDTVDIYRLKGQRNISLRFLSWFVLGLDIQAHTHDSVEDAKVALMLYEKYADLEKRGEFHNYLLSIYEAGRSLRWSAPNWNSKQ